MKISNVKKFILMLCLISLASSRANVSCYADNISQMKQQEAATKETISNLEKQTKETQNAISNLRLQKEATENVVDSLESQSDQLQDTVDEYNEQLDEINAQIKSAEEAMQAVSSEIVRLNDELSEAKAKEDYQYAQLKNQMKASYMSKGKDNLVSILLECNSIRGLLNTTRYMEAVLDFNQRKLAEFRELQAQISQKKEEVETKQSEIDEYQNALDGKYSELYELTGEVMDDLDATNSSISNARNNLASFNLQLQNLDSKMKALESQTAAAQAQLAQQIAARLAAGEKEYTGGSYAASASELEWLAATIQAEADGESYTGKLAVGSVIMNRVKSSVFPNSITGVITQSNQFASYRSGKVELIINNGPNSTCIQAAKEVLDGARVGDYLFFMTKPYADHYGIKDYTMIGNHAFFYTWNTGNGGGSSKPSEESNDEEEPANEQQDDEGGEYIDEPTEEYVEQDA